MIRFEQLKFVVKFVHQSLLKSEDRPVPFSKIVAD